MNIALCDDEPLLLEELNGFISDWCNERHLPYHISLFQAGEHLVNSDGFFDIIFLDIKMNGLSGLDTARLIRDKNNKSRLIFLTAYQEYVFQAFDVDASHYLLKPVKQEKLFSVLDHIQERIEYTESESLHIKTGNATYRIPVNDIRYLEVIDRKISLHTASGRVVNFYEKISNLEQQLSGYFFRCHRSYLVNLNYVFRFDNTNVYMDNGETLPLSRRKYNHLSQVFLDYLRKEE